LVLVELTKAGREIECLVRDNGIGRKAAEAKAGTTILSELALGAGISLATIPCETGSSYRLKMTAIMVDSSAVTD
jgi:hypothetical protein